ncbi:MAG TPA: type II toxin-antitoxin system VapC family toxin [Anaerolineales bacterium]|nr:type II toxin-antitoxin system VapC family toxin [Anaerolineales bacterium]HNA55155.1 type II toxin-antitoxin system VapC family toxin [Anaerolineales bacterium]HNB88614.1 type II toxin-antitoxin system VapC family toxin [Anaerolineales bacterium]HNE67448.1 type II toxin-antitoxin system VapC family toxin [Anaerolineales bacterium]HNF36539.1 type II toxin-antitoxin system VapC family toxin [Anaerolineales bacterium]
MKIAVDTSAIIAVIADEPEKAKLVELTKGSTIIVPPSVTWEVGNAFSAMMKKTRVNLEQAIEAIKIYQEISMETVEINLQAAIQLAGKHNIYAYDAYILQCALEHSVPLITLDKDLAETAKKEGVQVIEV